MFWRLASNTKYVGKKAAGILFDIIQYELRRRLLRRLRKYQLYIDITFDNIDNLREYYIRLNNYFHQAEYLNKTIGKHTLNGITTSTNIAARVIYVAPVIVSKALVPFAFRTIPKITTPAIISGSNCYICGNPDHFAKDCPSGKQVRFAPRSAIPGQISKVQEADVNNKERDPPATDQVDSENE